MDARKDNISQYVKTGCKCISNCGAYEVFLIGLVSNFKAETKNLTYVLQHIFRVKI